MYTDKLITSRKYFKMAAKSGFPFFLTTLYGPYEADFTKCLNNYDHYMQFLSTQFGKGHTLLCLAQNTGPHIVVPSTKHRCFYKMPKMFWWCGIK